MSQSANEVTSRSDDRDDAPVPVLSFAELRRLISAATAAGKTPALFLHDTLIAAIDRNGTDEASLERESRDWIAPARELTDAIRAMIEPIDEVLGLLETIPVQIELDEEASRRLAELSADPPEPNDYLKAAFTDYRRALATGGAPYRR